MVSREVDCLGRALRNEPNQLLKALAVPDEEQPKFGVIPLKLICTIFEISSLQTWFFNLIFCLLRTGFLQATQAVKIKFAIDK